MKKDPDLATIFQNTVNIPFVPETTGEEDRLRPSDVPSGIT